jgi:hypothetical protein
MINKLDQYTKTAVVLGVMGYSDASAPAKSTLSPPLGLLYGN